MPAIFDPAGAIVSALSAKTAFVDVAARQVLPELVVKGG